MQPWHFNIHGYGLFLRNAGGSQVLPVNISTGGEHKVSSGNNLHVCRATSEGDSPIGPLF